ncbi:ABC transporter permease [Variovorax paradoxus]|uniref:Putative aliphatic sulfonates transport permease protein SsuC n=1 Tax=Variovorax paradoxus TaxID=34073 RepID=A0A0H2LUB5_VARPD|nr:ABC transporter permease [Variovorax paradoxus]KLN52052.1 putative aliphatic sulfonates transport permease protein SsuC [Variovorax paradoxus]
MAAPSPLAGFYRRFYRRIERAIVPVLVLVGWELFSRSGVLPRALLPAPSQVLVAWADWVFATDGNTQSYSGRWIFDTLASASRVFAGFALATLLGVGIGMAIGWSRTVEKLIEPLLQVLRPVPPVSWIPLAIIWFGIADKPAIFLVFLGSFFPVLLSTIHGVKTCDRNLLRAGAMAGGSPRKLLCHIVFPAALPSIFSGLRIAIGSAWMLTVTAEMVAVKSGVGYVLWDSYYFLRYDLVIAAMVSIGLLGFLSDLAIKLMAARVLRWQRGSTLQAKEG